jgi:hypothetical protein
MQPSSWIERSRTLPSPNYSTVALSQGPVQLILASKILYCDRIRLSF